MRQSDNQRKSIVSVCSTVCLIVSLSHCLIVSTIAQQPAPAPDAYQKAVTSLDSDLARDLQKLAALRQEIAAEKPELARKANEAALALRQKKRQYDIATATQSSVDHELETRDKHLKLFREERLYMDGMLAEFRKNFRSSIPLPEAAVLETAFTSAEREGDLGTAASFDLLETLTRQISEFGRVRAIPGEALGKDGILVKGQFAIAGPVSWFASGDGLNSGLVAASRSLQSTIVPGTDDLEAITALLAGANATATFDPTLGNALTALEEQEDNLISYLIKGGIWMYPILALGILGLLAALAKWFQLRRIRPFRPAAIQEVIDAVNQQNPAGAKLAAAKIHHPAAALLLRGIEVAGLPIDDVEESLYAKYLEAQPRLQRGLPFIAIAAAASPLFGLLGTVTGMIKTFDQITIFGNGDPRTLSGGISEALLTTAFGLIIAIPALILHALLSRKIQGIRSAMEMVSLAFINGLKREKKRDEPDRYRP